MKNKKIYLVGLLIIVFIINTVLVLTNCYTSIDNAVRHFIICYSSEATSKAMHFITFFGSTKWIIILCVTLFALLLYKKKKSYAFSIASIIIVSTVVNNVIKLIIQRPRPEYISVIEHSFSYPSGHTMASFTVYGFLIYLLLKSGIERKYKVIFSTLLGLLILFVGISRIYLGAHYFSDVFGGMILSLMGLIIYSIIDEEKGLLK